MTSEQLWWWKIWTLIGTCGCIVALTIACNDSFHDQKVAEVLLNTSHDPIEVMCAFGTPNPEQKQWCAIRATKN